MCTHLDCFFVVALKVICRTVGTFIPLHLAAVAYFVSSGSECGAKIRGIVHLLQALVFLGRCCPSSDDILYCSKGVL
jgi:hypothetical protein